MASSVTTGVDRRHSYQPGTARAAWSYRSFRILFIGMALSSIGTWMQNLTLPAYIDHRTGSASLVGLLVFTQLGPLLLLSIPAGVLADRVNRTHVVILMQTLMLVAALGLAALVWADAPLWTLFVMQFVIGVANALNAPAFSASLNLLVDRPDRPGAVSLNAAMINGTRILGPALAALLAMIGFSVAQLLLVNAATFLCLIIPLFRVPLPDLPGNHPEQGWRRLLSGINITRRRKVLGRTLTSMSLFSLVCLPFVGLFPSVARISFGLDPNGAEFRWLYVVWGLGALAGSLAVGTVFSSFDKRQLVTPGFVMFGVSLAAFALVRSSSPAFPIAVALGFFYFMTATSLITVLQQNLDDHERGAVLPLWFMAWGGSIPIGNLIAGPIMDRVGSRPVLLVGAGFALVLARWADLTRLEGDALLAHPKVNEYGPESHNPESSIATEAPI